MLHHMQVDYFSRSISPIEEMDEVRRVRGCLSSRWHVHAPEDWIEACIQWIRDENQGSNLGTDTLNNMVYEQWLLSDLRELGSHCLPQMALHQDTFTLTGHYCLQMESVVDVSVSFYSQLQKVRGTDNSNVQVTACTQYTQKDAKAGRMLMMKLTDGSVDLQGMEYQPLPSLSVDTTPGTKLLIRGSVLCRLGVLMLKRENVLVLGGEVESLVEQNNKERLLAQMLGQNEELAQRPAQPQRTDYNPRPSSRSEQTVISAQNRTRVPENEHTDEFPEDDLLDNLDAAQLAAIEQEDWEDDIDFDLADTIPAQNAFADRHGSSVAMVDTGYGPSQSQIERSRITPSGNVNSLTAASEVNHVRNHTDFLSVDNVVTSTRNGLCMDRARNDLYSSNSGNARTISRVNGTSRTHSVNVNSHRPDQNLCRSSSTPGSRPLFDSAQPVSTGSRQSLLSWQTERSCGNEDLVDLTTPEADDDSVFHLEHVAKRPKIAAVVTPMKKALGVDSEPFTYLSKVKQFLPATEEKTFKVKAYIGTLLSKLEHGDGMAWSLRVKLNDGTATMDCDLSNEMLSSLIGFTAADSVQMREAARKDKRIRQQLSEGIKSCQRSLIQMNSILKIAVSPHRPLPYICSEMKLTAEDWASLERRVISAIGVCPGDS